MTANVHMQVWDASTPHLERMARDGHGRLLSEQRGHNKVPLVGRNLLRDLIAASFLGESVVGVTHFAFGTGDTPTTDSDTELEAEVLRDAVTQITKASSALTIKYFLSSTTLNGVLIGEAGLLNGVGFATLIARYVLLPALAKDNTVAVSYNWTISLTSGND